MADICGRFVWYENLTTDAVAAVAFYRAVVGWDTQEWAAGTGEPYRMLGNGKAMLAGVMTLPPGAEAPPHWLGYIATPDAKATTARAEALGATIRVRLMEIPTVGTFSVIQDPQGAYFAAFTPASSEASPIRPPQVGEVSWHELLTTDAEAAFAFYADLFAWEKKSSLDMGPMGIYQVFGLSSLDLGGIFRKPADVPGPSHWRSLHPRRGPRRRPRAGQGQRREGRRAAHGRPRRRPRGGLPGSPGRRFLAALARVSDSLKLAARLPGNAVPVAGIRPPG